MMPSKTKSKVPSRRKSQKKCARETLLQSEGLSVEDYSGQNNQYLHDAIV